MTGLPVYILAGGKSSRFGSDKARAVLEGQPLILRLAQALKPWAQRLTVIADQPGKYDDLGLTTIADRTPGLGPLGGVWTALLDAQQHQPHQPCWTLVAPCDLLIIKPAWVEVLLAHRQADAEAVAFGDGRWQPLPGLYHTALARRIQQQIERGELALHRLLDESRAVAAPLPADWPTLFQANTPQDLARYRSDASP
ncbi:MAG TPA: molybdenum cofactor guanylyltransferase [Phycisphaeraceae bacterium]